MWWCFSSSPGLLSTSRDSATSTSNPLTCSGQSTNICSTSPVCQTRVTARLQSECCRSFLLHVPHSQPPPLPGSQPQVQVSSLLYLLTQFSLIILLKLTILYFIIKVTNEIFNVQYWSNFSAATRITNFSSVTTPPPSSPPLGDQRSFRTYKTKCQNEPAGKILLNVKCSALCVCRLH